MLLQEPNNSQNGNISGEYTSLISNQIQAPQIALPNAKVRSKPWTKNFQLIHSTELQVIEYFYLFLNQEIILQLQYH